MPPLPNGGAALGPDVATISTLFYWKSRRRRGRMTQFEANVFTFIISNGIVPTANSVPIVYINTRLNYYYVYLYILHTLLITSG